MSNESFLQTHQEQKVCQRAWNAKWWSRYRRRFRENRAITEKLNKFYALVRTVEKSWEVPMLESSFVRDSMNAPESEGLFLGQTDKWTVRNAQDHTVSPERPTQIQEWKSWITNDVTQPLTWELSWWVRIGVWLWGSVGGGNRYLSNLRLQRTDDCSLGNINTAFAKENPSLQTSWIY